MTLTFNQVLFLVLTIAGVVALIFLTRLLIQLRRTAAEAERTAARAGQMMAELQTIQRKVDAGVDDAGAILGETKKVMTAASEFALFLSTQVVRPARKYSPIVVPLLHLALRQWGKSRIRKKEKC